MDNAATPAASDSGKAVPPPIPEDARKKEGPVQEVRKQVGRAVPPPIPQAALQGQEVPSQTSGEQEAAARGMTETEMNLEELMAMGEERAASEPSYLPRVTEDGTPIELNSDGLPKFYPNGKPILYVRNQETGRLMVVAPMKPSAPKEDERAA